MKKPKIVIATLLIFLVVVAVFFVVAGRSKESVGLKVNNWSDFAPFDHRGFDFQSVTSHNNDRIFPSGMKPQTLSLQLASDEGTVIYRYEGRHSQFGRFYNVQFNNGKLDFSKANWEPQGNKFIRPFQTRPEWLEDFLDSATITVSDGEGAHPRDLASQLTVSKGNIKMIMVEPIFTPAGSPIKRSSST